MISRQCSDRFKVTHTEDVMMTDHSRCHGNHAKSSMIAMAATRFPHEGKLATSDDHGQAFCGTIEANLCHGGLT